MEVVTSLPSPAAPYSPLHPPLHHPALPAHPYAPYQGHPPPYQHPEPRLPRKCHTEYTSVVSKVNTLTYLKHLRSSDYFEDNFLILKTNFHLSLCFIKPLLLNAQNIIIILNV